MKLSGVEAPWGQGTGGDGVMGDRVGQGRQGDRKGTVRERENRAPYGSQDHH